MQQPPNAAPQSVPPGYDHRPQQPSHGQPQGQAPHAQAPHGQAPQGYAQPQYGAAPPHDIRTGFESRIAASITNGSIWMRLFGYMSIVGGAMYCLTLVGLIFGWLPIMIGMWLVNADKAGQRYASTGDPAQLYEYIEGIRKYFMVVGIMAAISLVLGVLMAAVYGAVFGSLAMAAMSNM